MIHCAEAVLPGCTVRLAYAPNRSAPLQETWEMGSRGARPSAGFFNFDAMLARLPPGLAARDQGAGVFAWKLVGLENTCQSPHGKLRATL